MSANERGRARWAWVPVLLLMTALGALALAIPAAAQDGQDADVSQRCNAGDGDGNDAAGSNDSGDCGNQRRVVQQSAGGDVSRSINQTQTFGDGDSVRTSDDEDRDRDDEETDDFEAQDDGASAASDDFDCQDFSNQAEAQGVLDEDSSDPFNLDADGDDRACEEEFGQAVRGAPEGGIETGGGGTLTPRLAHAEEGPSTAAEVAPVAGPLALALIVAGLLGLRRGRTT